MTLAGPYVHLVWLKGGLGYGSLALRWRETKEQPPFSEKFDLEAFVLYLFLCCPFINPPICNGLMREQRRSGDGPIVQSP